MDADLWLFSLATFDLQLDGISGEEGWRSCRSELPFWLWIGKNRPVDSANQFVQSVASDLWTSRPRWIQTHGQCQQVKAPRFPERTKTSCSLVNAVKIILNGGRLFLKLVTCSASWPFTGQMAYWHSFPCTPPWSWWHKAGRGCCQTRK